MRSAECPYCQGTLKKVPSAKTKCPHCGKYMYVRTFQPENVRKVVTKEAVEEYERQFQEAIESYHYDAFGEELRKLDEGNGIPLPRDERKWLDISNRLKSNAREGSWGVYRNDWLDLADLCYQERRKTEALCAYLEVFYLDLNGPSNSGFLSDDGSTLTYAFPPFDPLNEFVTGVVVFKIKVLMKNLSFDMNRLKDLFIDYCSSSSKGVPLRLNPEDCWSRLEEELQSES